MDSTHIATFGGGWKSPEEAKVAAKEIAAKGWEPESIVHQHGEYKVRVSSYKEPQYVKEIKAGSGTPVQRARAITAAAKVESQKYEILETKPEEKGLMKIGVKREYRITGAKPPPEKITRFTYGAKDLTTGEETHPKKIVENVRISAAAAEKHGLISQREAEIGKREGREYYTSTQAAEISATLKKAYGDKVLVSPGVSPATTYYQYHQRREEALDKLAKAPLTKTLYTVGPGFLGFGVMFSMAESRILGEKHETFQRKEHEKIKRWVEVPMDYAPKTIEFKRWAAGSGFMGATAFVGTAATVGVLGPVAKFGISSVWAAGTGLQIGTTIKQPSLRNIIRTGIYIAPAVVYGGAKGAGRIVGHFRAQRAPVSHSVLKSEVFIHPGGKAATGKAHVLSRVGSGKKARYAASKIDSGMVLDKKLGVDFVRGTHRVITKSGAQTKRSIAITEDLGITGKETSVAFHTGKIISRGKPSEIIFKKAPGGLKPVKLHKPDVARAAGAYGTRKISEVRYPGVRQRAGRPYQRVETHGVGGEIISGKKGIITYKVSQGPRGPEIAADAFFLGKTFQNRFAGITRIYSLPKGAGGTGPSGAVLRSRASGSLGSVVETGKTHGAALARSQLAKDISPKISFKPLPAPIEPVVSRPPRIVSAPTVLDVVVRSPAKLILGPKPIDTLFIDQKRRVSPMLKTEQRVIGKTQTERAATPVVVPMTPELTTLREHERVIPLIHTPQVFTSRMVQRQSQALLFATVQKTKTKVAHPVPVSHFLLPSTFVPATMPAIPPVAGMDLGEVLVRGKKKKRPWWAGMYIHPVKDPISAMGFDFFMKPRRKGK